jgi:hypothetical protein
MIERFTFDRLTAVLLFVSIATAACLMPAQNDTWWQLRAGHDMWATRQFLIHDTFSHTVTGTAWPNHEWLSQVVLYAAYATGGVPLVTMLAAAVVTAAWALVWLLTPGRATMRLLLIVCVMASASTSWSPRPQVFSLLLVMATVFLLQRRRYAWLPPLFCLWANLHGAVLLGVGLLAAALGASIVEHDELRSRARLAVAAALSIAATMATPLGWHFWLEIAQSLGRIRQLGIDEWAAPRISSLTLLPFWIAAVALVAGVAVRAPALLRNQHARRAGQLTLCASALMLLPGALTAVRNVPPFLMVAVPALAVLWAAPWTPEDRRAAAGRPALNAAIAASAFVLATIVVAAAYIARVPRLNWTPLPAASLAALDRCDGNMYNRYDEGGYLIWFAPRHKVFLDGRQDPYPPALIHAQMDAESSGDASELFRRYAIGCAYLPVASPVAQTLMRSGWTMLYRDAGWAVLSRSAARS